MHMSEEALESDHITVNTTIHLTIIPRARMGYWIRGHEGKRNNCFSKIQLVGQTYIENKTSSAS